MVDFDLKNLGVWEPVIGLEVHVHLATRTKLFCGCELVYGASPNSRTCPVCQGMPGVLPIPNKQAVTFAVKMGLAVQGKVNEKSRFARKHYFYPDLPKGYQISQYEAPIISGGKVPIWWEGAILNVPLTRIHMEEDAGKIIHDPGNDESLVDLNRCGAPLIEIVTDPAITHPRQASLYLDRVRQLVRYLTISGGDMEKGQLRCDANISLRKKGSKTLGTKTEIKNLNSIKSVERSLFYEIQRQKRILDEGGRISQGTYLWDEKAGRSDLMRTKEEAQDYRYLPDPDLPTLRVARETLSQVKKTLPELPHKKEMRWIQVHGIKEEEAQVLSRDRTLADYFDACVNASVIGKTASHWILSDLVGLLHEKNLSIEDLSITPERLAELIQTVESGLVNRLTGKDILYRMQTDLRRPKDIIKAEGLSQDSDEMSLEKEVETVLVKFPEEVTRFQRGKKGLMGFFIGQIMKETKGKSNPGVLKKILEKKLG